MSTNHSNLADFDKLWNYAQPAQTEQKFRALLPLATQAANRSYLAQLLTQIARCQGLQSRFDDAHQTLNDVEKMLTNDLKLARVRCLLERGRVFNSAGQPARAMPFFVQAYELANTNQFVRYAIDAVHMIAIVNPDPARQVEWNLKGIAMVDADPSQRGWLWSLYNNIAESYSLLHEYQTSLDYILKLIDYQKERGEVDPYTLKDKARFLHLTGRADQSLPIIRRLTEKEPDDRWFKEELAETLRALNAGGST